MHPERKKALEEECAKLNARAVVHRLELMQNQLDDYKQQLAQQAQQIALLQNRFNVELQLRDQILRRGRGPSS